MKLKKIDMEILQMIIDKTGAKNNSELLQHVTRIYDSMSMISRNDVYGKNQVKLLDYERPDLENMK